MSWIKINDDLWIHDKASYSIEKIDNVWGVVDSKEKRLFIPFEDIFSNPVFPSGGSYPNLDFIVKNLIAIENISGNSLNITETARAKHFRGELTNSPETPSFSSQGDSDTGFYHISSGVFGYSSNGNKKGEFGDGYGGFIGNLIQLIGESNTFQNTSSALTFVDINKSLGVVWEYSITPRFKNSKIFVLYKMCSQFLAAKLAYRVLMKINNGAYSIVYNPLTAANNQTGQEFGGAVAGINQNDQSIIPFLINPSYNKGDILTFKIQLSTGSSTVVNPLVTGTGTNSGHSEIFIAEILNDLT